MADNWRTIVTDDDRAEARAAIENSYPKCGRRMGPSTDEDCDCDPSKVAGCKALIEGVAEAIATARRM